MRLVAYLLIPTLVLLIAPVHAEVNIFIENKTVNLGDVVKIQVSVGEVNRSLDVVISGERDGEVLCSLNKGENFLEKCGGEWTFKIPEDWEEGTYHLKVTVHDVEPEEYFEDFKVVKPKITDVEVPELVYQGKTKLKVFVESANDRSIVELRLMGDNFDYLRVKERADYKESENLYSAEPEIDLKQFYERSRDISDAIAPGNYLLEIRLEYEGKVWDTRRITTSIVEPELKVEVKENVTAGEPLLVSIETNRKEDYEYNGILVVVKGENFLAYREALLDSEGKAEVQFETFQMDEGGYTVYVRDTSKTSTISSDVLARDHIDLSPESYYARIIHAHDDVLVRRNVWITADEGEDVVKVFVEPLSGEIYLNQTVTLNVSLSKPIKLTSFDFTLSVSGGALAIESVELERDAKSIERVVDEDFVMIKAVSYGKSKFSTLIKLRVHAKSEGEAFISIRDVRLFDEEGKEIEAKSQASKIAVVPLPEAGKVNATISMNFSDAGSAKQEMGLKENSTDSKAPNTSLTTITVTEPVKNTSLPIQVDFMQVGAFAGAFATALIAGRFFMQKRVSKPPKKRVKPKAKKRARVTTSPRVTKSTKVNVK